MEVLKISEKNTERNWTRIKMAEELLKKSLRQDMKAKRNALTEDEKYRAAAKCLSKLKALPDFMKADWVYAYIACRNELETKDIISWCIRNGKHVAVPKVHGEYMHFYEITSLEDLCLCRDWLLTGRKIVLDMVADFTINISHPMRRL